MATINLATIAFTVPSTTILTTNTPKEFSVCNTSPQSAANGGYCCNFVAPAGTTWITFEMWGGGSGGGGACCCMQSTQGGGAGSYAIKTINCGTTGGLAGASYTICAASSGNCAGACYGCGGYTSYVTGPGLSNFCAQPARSGDTHCFAGDGYYIPCVMCFYCCACGGDLNISGANGSALTTQYCFAYSYGYTAVAAATVSGPVINGGQCGTGGGANGVYGYGIVPGGGGQNATSFGGGCCFGGFGNQGQVSVTYG